MRRKGDNQRRSRKQERKLAKRFKGKIQPASGATWGSKGDVRSEQVLFEAKTTKAKQYTLKIDTMDKIEREALAAGRIPVLQVTFERPRREYAVLTLNDLQSLLANRELVDSL